jgi:hypothetical protein
MPRASQPRGCPGPSVGRSARPRRPARSCAATVHGRGPHAPKHGRPLAPSDTIAATSARPAERSSPSPGSRPPGDIARRQKAPDATRPILHHCIHGKAGGSLRAEQAVAEDEQRSSQLTLTRLLLSGATRASAAPLGRRPARTISRSPVCRAATGARFVRIAVVAARPDGALAAHPMRTRRRARRLAAWFSRRVEGSEWQGTHSIAASLCPAIA